jgi:hypothetical protein
VDIADYENGLFGVNEIKEVTLVAQLSPYRKWDREREIEKENDKKKRGAKFESVLTQEKENRKEKEQYGSFFEARV